VSSYNQVVIRDFIIVSCSKGLEHSALTPTAVDVLVQK